MKKKKNKKIKKVKVDLKKARVKKHKNVKKNTKFKKVKTAKTRTKIRKIKSPKKKRQVKKIKTLKKKFKLRKKNISIKKTKIDNIRINLRSRQAILKIIRLKDKLNFNFKYSFSLDQFILGFFESIARSIRNFKIILAEEKERKKQLKIKLMEIEKINSNT